jgi:DnaJ-class molecular chaperone
MEAKADASTCYSSLSRPDLLDAVEAAGATSTAVIGERGCRPGPRRGADLRYDLEINLEQAYAGAEVEITGFGKQWKSIATSLEMFRKTLD